MSGERSDPSEEGPETETELERVTAERDALRDALEQSRSPRRRGRRTLVGGLVALTCLLVLLSTVVVWAHVTLLNTTKFVNTVEPVIRDRVVTAEVATRVTDQLFTALNVQGRLQSALPEPISGLAAPLSQAAEGFVRDKVTEVLQSREFVGLMLASLRHTHAEVVAALRGQSTPALRISDGKVTLNLLPVLNEALGQAGTTISGLLGRQVTLPTISGGELPPQAIARISSALGVPLPGNLGQITLVESSQLTAVQSIVGLSDVAVVGLPILTLVILALTLWLSLSRRRTLIQLMVGSALLLVILRHVVTYSKAGLVAHATNPPIAGRVVDELLRGFYTSTAWLLVAALVVLLVALVTGPYPWAVGGRQWVGQLTTAAVSAGQTAGGGTAGAWVGAHRNALMAAAAGVAVVILWAASLSWPWLIVVLALLVAVELLLYRIAAESPDPR